MARPNEPIPPEPNEDEAPPEPEMVTLQLVFTGVLGMACGVAGVIAVFRTSNEVGSAALLALGVYFVVATILRRFPRLKLGDNEIDPSVRRELRSVKRLSLQAIEEAEGAKEDAEDAKEYLSSGSGSAARDDGGLAARLDGRIADLVAEYNEVRGKMPRGRARERRMTDLVESMIAGFRQTGVPSDARALLASEDHGLRLAGAAAVYAEPKPGAIPALVQASVQPTKPFNEYWALQALRKAVEGHCESLSEEARNQLRARLRELHAGTDRAGEIREILGMCP